MRGVPRNPAPEDGGEAMTSASSIPPPPLTDDELADLYQRFVVGPTTILDSVDYPTLARLIEELRASRVERNELRAKLATVGFFIENEHDPDAPNGG